MTCSVINVLVIMCTIKVVLIQLCFQASRHQLVGCIRFDKVARFLKPPFRCLLRLVGQLPCYIVENVMSLCVCNTPFETYTWSQDPRCTFCHWRCWHAFGQLWCDPWINPEPCQQYWNHYKSELHKQWIRSSSCRLRDKGWFDYWAPTPRIEQSYTCIMLLNFCFLSTHSVPTYPPDHCQKLLSVTKNGIVKLNIMQCTYTTSFTYWRLSYYADPWHPKDNPDLRKQLPCIRQVWSWRRVACDKVGRQDLQQRP